jgi:hypothetical protein
VWEIEATDELAEWFDSLTEAQQEALDDRVRLLAERGPDLGRPVVERIQSARHHHMKELRASSEGALRVLFMFDPRRQVILLLGGDKTGQWESWYRWAIPKADELYDEYLDELRAEGLM